jgi:hypothetical protein
MLRFVKKDEIVLKKDELQRLLDEEYKRGVNDGIAFTKCKVKTEKCKDGMKTDGGKTLKFG